MATAVVTYNIDLPVDLSARLDAEAKRTGESKAAIIRRLLDKGLPGKGER